MRAEVLDEDDRGVGVRVTDNAGVKHTVAVGFDGEVQGHSQDGYPDDPAERTTVESERINQAERFARYYLYRERGYDTLPPRERPEHVVAVRAAVDALGDDRFAELFGDLHRQLLSHTDPSVDPPLDPPADIGDPDTVFYLEEVFVGVDPTGTDFEGEARALAEEYGLDFDALDRSVEELSSGAVADWTRVGEELAAVADRRGGDVADALEVEGVSALGMAYLTPDGEQRETDLGESGRPPDARIELPVGDVPGDVTEFRAVLDHHLACQVRDCYVVMGVLPPEEVRTLGPGRKDAAGYYRATDLYPELYDPDSSGAFDRLRSLFS